MVLAITPSFEDFGNIGGHIDIEGGINIFTCF